MNPFGLSLSKPFARYHQPFDKLRASGGLGERHFGYSDSYADNGGQEQNRLRSP